ncbi:Na+/H+ antiporter subunit E [bacterium]|nr:Na+/H+ antiporter subunit E [bacterium]
MTNVWQAIVPRPLHSLTLFVVWLLLSGQVNSATLTIATLLSLLIPRILTVFCDPIPMVKRPLAAAIYLAKLLYDIVLSSGHVTINVLKPSHQLTPGFIRVPLLLEDEFVMALLASSVSLTPGTVSADVDEDKQYLYVHVLHLTDEEALVNTIIERYEMPLKRIFQC